MFEILQIVTLLLVAIATALSVAHALEFPGKLRLSREHYLAIQPIYYPGFTIGGASEPAGIIALLLLCFFTPTGTPQFWLTACAFAALAFAHAIYWMFTHPVNNFWLKDFQLKRLGAGFFGIGNSDQKQQAEMPEWTELRDRWEFSHCRARFVFDVESGAVDDSTRYLRPGKPSLSVRKKLSDRSKVGNIFLQSPVSDTILPAAH